MKRFLAVSLLMIWLVVIAHASDLRLIAANAVDVESLLPPPPATGSQEATTELETLLKLQANRTEADVARAKAEIKLSPAAFQRALGREFTAENFPVTFALLEDAARDSKQFSDKAKESFARRRPYDAEPHIQPAIERETNTSYPSGHATRGMLMARILCEIVPDKTDQLLRRGEEIGWDRVLAGVHYPSDVYSGRVLGQAIANAMLNNAEFKNRLREAQAEFEAVDKPHSLRNAPARSQ